jgi:2-dehydro-3-deoxyphosphogluconate aldolase/(4S)-4-hydroxy-2-oxoglutarate aldolase
VKADMNSADVNVLERIARRRIVPVVVLEQVELAEPLAETLLKAGLDVIEVTFRTPTAASAIRKIAARFPEMLQGAGTLLEPDQVRRAIEAGACFAVAPGLNERVVEAARAAGIEAVPGVMTPSEVEKAMSLGCRTLKFFPAEQAGGAAMLKALEGAYATRACGLSRPAASTRPTCDRISSGRPWSPSAAPGWWRRS